MWLPSLYVNLMNNLMNKCLRIHCLSPFIVFRRWVESFVEEVDGVSVFRRLRSGCEVDTVLQSAPTPPSDASFGYSDLPVRRPTS